MQESDLMKRNFVVVIDKSGSMSTPIKNGQTRWNAAYESTLAIANKCSQFDSDGIDVFTFNEKFTEYNNCDASKVDSIFKNEDPMGGTDFVPVLKKVFDNHFKNSTKPTTVLVITDGEPSNGAGNGKKQVGELIVATANKLEADNDLSISFLQVGDDPAATKFLKSLDDDLQKAGAKFDIVDTKTFEELQSMSIVDILLASVND